MFAKITFDDLKVVLRDTGTLIGWSSILFLVPIIFSLFFGEPLVTIFHYIVVALFSFIIGMTLQKFFKTEKETELKHALLTTTIVWLLFTLLAALPFTLIFETPLIDAYFEAMSALTTTGLSIVEHLNSMPLSLIFWRSMLSWIGGIGIIMLALIGVLSTYTKSIKLMKAEGRDQKFRPNLRNTLKEIMIIYVILTLLGIALLALFGGMGLWDSLNYSMSAISTTGMDITQGGFATKANFANIIILSIIMILGATSFSTHYFFMRKKKFDAYLKDKEFLIMLMLGILGIGLVVPKLAVFYGSEIQAIASAIFHVFSAITCGGFGLDKGSTIGMWPEFVQLVFVGLMLVGGAAGSTAGGIKVSRFWVFVKSLYWKIKEIALPPKSFFAKRIEGRTLENKEIGEINQFIILYVLFIVASTLILTSQGFGFMNSLFEVTSAQSNVGISAGITAATLGPLTKAVLIGNMLVGRLEIIPLLSIISFLAGTRIFRDKT